MTFLYVYVKEQLIARRVARVCCILAPWIGAAYAAENRCRFYEFRI